MKNLTNLLLITLLIFYSYPSITSSKIAIGKTSRINDSELKDRQCYYMLNFASNKFLGFTNKVKLHYTSHNSIKTTVCFEITNKAKKEVIIHHKSQNGNSVFDVSRKNFLILRSKNGQASQKFRYEKINYAGRTGYNFKNVKTNKLINFPKYDRKRRAIVKGEDNKNIAKNMFILDKI